MHILKKIKYNSTLLLFIFSILLLALGTTYALLAINTTDSTASGVGGCSEVNYTGEDITTEDLVSTTNYTEGASSIVTLSKEEDCEIYTTVDIKIHTNNTTTAPIENIKALRYKIEKISGDGEILDGGDGFVDEIGEIVLARVTLTENVTTYKVYLWIDASLSMGYYNAKTYSGYIFAESEQTSTIGATQGATQINAYAANYMVPTATNDSTLDFSQTSKASNTNGVYYIEETINDKYPIYYYRGNVNNNLIFANTCWKVVRTTETGGLKLIYNGLPSNGQCNNTGSATTIGDNYFNENDNSPAYVGYMYGTPYAVDTQTMSSTTNYTYGNGVTYANGTYTLTNTISGTWQSLYNGGLNNNHYTCFSTGTTCSSVKYINYTTSSKVYYLTLTNGKRIEDALSEMLDNNTTSSTIKDTIDSWYDTNIVQEGYSNYIEDTVWCNDRSIASLGAFEPNGGGTRTNYQLYFEAYDRGWPNASPSLTCNRTVDKFTVSASKGNGALTYPVGLLTLDEIMLAGGKTNSANSKYYLYSGKIYWAGSPVGFGDSGARGTNVYRTGALDNYYVGNAYGVRPSLSLRPGFSLTGDGDGSATNPYKIS